MQLLLPVTINTSQTFSSFVEPAESNGLIINELSRAILSDEFTCHFIAGNSGVGRTHLLTACCHLANLKRKSSILLPLEQVTASSPELIDGLELVDVVCIDNFDTVVGNKDWENALFNLFNLLQQNKATVIFTGNQVPTELKISLPDLASRIQWCTLFQLNFLSNDEKQKALVQHAHLMGFELTEEVAKFMLNRLPRQMTFLMQALDTLAKQSIEKQRMVTVPFVKKILDI